MEVDVSGNVGHLPDKNKSRPYPIAELCHHHAKHRPSQRATGSSTAHLDVGGEVEQDAPAGDGDCS